MKLLRDETGRCTPAASSRCGNSPTLVRLDMDLKDHPAGCIRNAACVVGSYHAISELQSVSQEALLQSGGAGVPMHSGTSLSKGLGIAPRGVVGMCVIDRIIPSLR
jgi:hypothetical protein